MLRVGRFVGVSRIDLGLDVETNVAVTRTAYEREHLGQSWYPSSGDRQLLGKLRRIRTAGANLPDVVLLDLLQRQLHVGRTRCPDVLAVRTASQIGIQSALV